MRFINKIKPAYIIIILLTLISQRIAYNKFVYPHPENDITSENAILQGNEIPPYQYRVLNPMLAKAIDLALSPIIKNDISRHLAAHKILLYIVFFFLYLLFFLFLKNFYSDTTAIIGLLLLQIIIPLATTDNIWVEGDYITALFYLLAFFAMFKNKDYWILIIIAVGTLNREQTIFVLVFYIAYLWEQKRLFKQKSIIVLTAGIVLYAAVFFGLKFYFGFKESNSLDFNTSRNIGHWTSILRLWIEQVLIFVIVCIAVYKKTRLFIKLSFLSLIPYTTFFFFFGIMGELAKFLPAYIIMIAMSLQFFMKEYTGIELEKDYGC